MDVFLKIINQQIGHGRNTALRLGCVGFFQRRLAAQRNLILSCARYLKRKTHTGYTAADNQKIIFLRHVNDLTL